MDFLAQHSGQSMEKVEKDVERDFIMSAAQAKEYGLIDENHHQAPLARSKQLVSGTRVGVRKEEKGLKD